MWGYDPWGKRVMKNGNAEADKLAGYYTGTWEFTFYGMRGQRLATVGCLYDNGPQHLYCGMGEMRDYFGGRLLWTRDQTTNRTVVARDRLGSVRAVKAPAGLSYLSYYPYGEERGSSADGREKFGTYFRDLAGQDYADQRYYSNFTGRFWSPDPSRMNVELANPQSWNLYAYVNGDPINFNDPTGLSVWSKVWNSIKSFFGVNSGQPSTTGGENSGGRNIPLTEVQDGEGQTDDESGGGTCVTSKIYYLSNGGSDELCADARFVLSSVYNTTGALTGFEPWLQFEGASILLGATGAGASLYWGGTSLIVTPGVTAAGTTTVIGSLQTLAGSLGPNGSVLMQVPQTAYSWALNEQLLQNAINIGNPIRDMNGGVNAVPGSALALERQLLSAAGWILQQAADGYYYWMKP